MKQCARITHKQSDVTTFRLLHSEKLHRSSMRWSGAPSAMAQIEDRLFRLWSHSLWPVTARVGRRSGPINVVSRAASSVSQGPASTNRRQTRWRGPRRSQLQPTPIRIVTLYQNVLTCNISNSRFKRRGSAPPLSDSLIQPSNTLDRWLKLLSHC